MKLRNSRPCIEKERGVCMCIDYTNKAHLRRQMILRRQELSKEVLLVNSSQIMHNVFALPAFNAHPVIYAYMDYIGEVQTREFIIECIKIGKKVALPKVTGNHMEFFYIHSVAGDVEPGYQGILEPKTNLRAQEMAPFMLIPGVAFDVHRNRMGMGKGFYDRFLASCPDAYKVGVAFSFQMFERIPIEPTDIQMDCIITEDRIYV